MGEALMSAEMPVATRTRHQDDLCQWVLEQVELLRAGRLDEIDARNVAEELNDVGSSEHWKLWSTLRVLIMHMLKWDQQREFRTPSWVHSIREQRRRYQRLVEKSPSLKAVQDETVEEVYPVARDWASDETSSLADEFPDVCPYTWDDLLHRPFEVDEAARRSR